MRQANLVVYLFEAGDNIREIRDKQSELSNQGLNYLMVANKVDSLGEKDTRAKFQDVEKIIFISARQNLHVEVLKEKMVDAVLQGQVQTENVIVTNARHYHALKEAAKSLYDIKTGLDNKLPGDLLALDIRRCLHYLGEITGQVSNEDMLDFIFSKFCIGK